MKIIIGEKWTRKYKESIDCNNPKGFSQKAHCAGRKARQAGRDTKSEPVDEEIMPVSSDGDTFYLDEYIDDEIPPVEVDEELDRCARIAKRKYRVWPSAYASGAAVKCRKGKIWRGVKEEVEEQVEEEIEIIEEDPKVGTGKKPEGSGRRLYTDENPKDTVSVKFSTVQDIKDTLSKEHFKSKSHQRQSQIINLIHQRVRAAYENAKDPETKARLKNALDYAEERKEASKEKTKRMQSKNESQEQLEEKKKRKYKPNFKREKEQGLHGWFARNDGKGWVNCRTGGPCGRESADEGGKYPACRPTLAQCKSAGRGPLRKKKSSKPISWTPKKESIEMDIHSLILQEFRNVKLELMSEGTRYHVDTKTSLYNPIYRPGSKCFTRLMSEARQLRDLGHSFTSEELELLETDCGKFGIYEGRKVMLDVPMIEEDQIPPELADLAKKESGITANAIKKAASALDALIGGAKTQQLQKLADVIKQPTGSDAQQLKVGGDFSQVDPKQFLSYYLTSRKIKPETLGLKPEQLTEAEYKGKQVQLGKPQRGGSKKFYVYVKDGDRVKKISFGDPNLSVKVGDAKRRASFVARHNCKEKNDRLTAGYWACRIGRYPHLTGAKQRYTWW
jgi:hypothetical protein